MERYRAVCHHPARGRALTAREWDVISLVAVGKSNKVIAAELGLSQRTVEAHRARSFQKLRVRNAVELVLRLMPPDKLPSACV